MHNKRVFHVSFELRTRGRRTHSPIRSPRSGNLGRRWPPVPDASLSSLEGPPPKFARRSNMPIRHRRSPSNAKSLFIIERVFWKELRLRNGLTRDRARAGSLVIVTTQVRPPFVQTFLIAARKSAARACRAPTTRLMGLLSRLEPRCLLRCLSTMFSTLIDICPFDLETKAQHFSRTPMAKRRRLRAGLV